MSKKHSNVDLFDILADIVSVILAGHDTLKSSPIQGQSKQHAYRRAQRFCYGVVEKNLRDAHNFLYDDGKSLLYSTPKAYPLGATKEYRVEHGLPIVELAARWYQSPINANTVIDHGIFLPVVKLTKAEDKQLGKQKADEPRMSPSCWKESFRPSKRDRSLAHTNPDYDHPFRRNVTAEHQLRFVMDGQLVILGDAGEMTYQNHLSLLDLSRLKSLRKNLLVAFGAWREEDDELKSPVLLDGQIMFSSS